MDGGSSGDKKAVTSKSNKDFSLSPTQLLFELDESSLQTILSPPSAVIQNVKEAGDDFEKITLDSPFVNAAIIESQRGVTEKGAPTFNTSGDPKIDFFFHVMEQTSPERTIELLENSWKNDALTTLKLVASLRDIKDGKGIRQQYQLCLYWLYIHHPLTLYHNLSELLKFGYWKDALHMLMIALFNGFIHPYFGSDDGKSNKKKIQSSGPQRRRGQKRKVAVRNDKQSDCEKRIYNTIISTIYSTPEGIKDMNGLRLKHARDAFNNNKKYQVFFIKIAQIFATQLAADYNLLKEKKKADFSLAAKWAPTLEGHFDRYTLIGSMISLELAKILNPNLLTKGLSTSVYLCRKFYSKEVLKPIRSKLEIPEIYMSKNEWGRLNYRRVAAKCMQKNKTHFTKHDKDRFSAYLTKAGSKVAGATLKPIELMRRAMMVQIKDKNNPEIMVIEKQWTSLVDSIKAKGSLMSQAVAICDVSGSMNGDPLIAALGLTLITMGLTQEPWNEICLTFHEKPTVFHLNSSLSLMEKVFTDMEFDAAFPGGNETNFEVAQKKFEESGYKLPTIVFWNLRASSSSTPVQKGQCGTILLSGFSAQLLSSVMNQKDLESLTPLIFVNDIVEKEKYAALKIYD